MGGSGRVAPPPPVVVVVHGRSSVAELPSSSIIDFSINILFACRVRHPYSLDAYTAKAPFI